MKLERERVDIIIPTMDNIKQLVACCSSIIAMRGAWPIRIIIVNNGEIPIEEYFLPEDKELIVVVNPKKNLGWTGGIAEGLKHSDSKYVMFANDDIYIPVSSYKWMTQLVRHLIIWPNIAAVGPSSNCAMGSQNIWNEKYAFATMPTFLIGFCMLVRRETLDRVGGIDTSFVTGDDIDLSIRFMKAGHLLMVDNSVFVYHHGFQTGNRLHGDHTTANGWNSPDMTTNTNIKIIQKHGFKAFWNTMYRSLYEGWYKERYHEVKKHMVKGKLSETDAVVSSLDSYDITDILEIGCAGMRTIEGTLGLDLEAKGTPIPFTGQVCNADIQHNIENPFPFNGRKFKYIIARHVLEHCIDVMSVLDNCKNALDENGKLIISVPDERICDSILINGDHVHAFTPDSLTNIIKSAGLKVNKLSEFYGCDSFTLEVSK